MINEKYYADIKKFPEQFKTGFELAKDLKVEGEFNRVVLCGMGGSCWYAEMFNDFLAPDSTSKISIQPCRAYHLPKNVDEKTLFIISSYSGNTEETVSCLDEVQSKGYRYCIFTSGGKLLAKAKEAKAPLFQIPTGLQPRLSSGYFIAGMFKLLSNMKLISDKEIEVSAAAEKIAATLTENKAKELAQKLMNKVPIIYATNDNSSLAMVSKIKFNEDAKIQAFWNFFPEQSHNEMVGFTKMIMNPLFIIFRSQYTHPRNHKRIEIFSKLMHDQSLPVEVIELSGANVIEEILNGYYFISHVTYYLAEKYGVDPEPVDMVENFKKMLD